MVRPLIIDFTEAAGWDILACEAWRLRWCFLVVFLVSYCVVLNTKCGVIGENDKIAVLSKLAERDFFAVIGEQLLSVPRTRKPFRTEKRIGCFLFSLKMTFPVEGPFMCRNTMEATRTSVVYRTLQAAFCTLLRERQSGAVG